MIFSAILTTSLLFACRGEKNNTQQAGDSESTEAVSDWIDGDLDRPSITDDSEDEEEDFEGEPIGYLGAWYGEMEGVDPAAGFEIGEWGFAVLALYEEEEEYLCAFFTTMEFENIQNSCEECEFAFDVQLGPFETEGDVDLCTDHAEDIAFYEDHQVSFGYGEGSFWELRSGEWEQKGSAEWEVEEGFFFFYDEFEIELE